MHQRGSNPGTAAGHRRRGEVVLSDEGEQGADDCGGAVDGLHDLPDLGAQDVDGQRGVLCRSLLVAAFRGVFADQISELFEVFFFAKTVKKRIFFFGGGGKEF